MKLGTLVKTSEALQEFLKVKINSDKAFELRVAIKKANAELTSFEEIRTSKIKEYGEEFTDENGQPATRVKTENIEKFSKEINELSEKEVDVSFPEIKKDDIKGDIETSILLQLDYLIK